MTTTKRKPGPPRGPRPIKVCETCGSEYKTQCMKCRFDRRMKQITEAQQRKKEIFASIKAALKLADEIGENLVADMVMAFGVRQELVKAIHLLTKLHYSKLLIDESAAADLDGSEQARIDDTVRHLLADLDI